MNNDRLEKLIPKASIKENEKTSQQKNMNTKNVSQVYVASFSKFLNVFLFGAGRDNDPIT